jgi:hypothetical protein
VVAEPPQDEYDAARQRLRGLPTGGNEAVAEALDLVHAALAGARDTDRDQLLAALIVLRHLRDELASWEPELITAARELGVSWRSLAPALGVTSRQAAERRYLRQRTSTGGEPTAEGRVRAVRDKRAGDRAVAAWARQNSGSLRQLAGQVSALDGLTARAQEQVDLVQQALVDDDPSALLSPLADAHTHLDADHAKLAGKIRSVADQVEQLRRDALERHGNSG